MSDILENTLEYNDLKEGYIKSVKGESVCSSGENNKHIQELVSSWRHKSNFYGPSSEEVIFWLHNGYRQPGLTLDPPIDPIRKRRRLKFAEEGELQLDLMWSGHDYPFLQWDQREVMPGINVEIRVNFVASTNVDVIIAYNRWILRALIALEEAGVDLEVNLSTKSTSMFKRGYEQLHQNIRVKKVGEQTDFLAWSPMLSPGGFRHLVFLSYIVASDMVGKVAANGLGRGTNQGDKWAVVFDNETGKLKFQCPWAPYDFPETEMEMQLRDVLNQARRVA